MDKIGSASDIRPRSPKQLRHGIMMALLLCMYGPVGGSYVDWPDTSSIASSAAEATPNTSSDGRNTSLMLQPFFTFRPERAAAATAAIFVTTADDAIWLVPFVCSGQYATLNRVVHMLVFIVALQLLCVGSYLASLGLDKAARAGIRQSAVESPELVFGIVAVALTWLLVVFLIIKRVLKMRRKAAKKAAKKAAQKADAVAVSETNIQFDSCPIEGQSPSTDGPTVKLRSSKVAEAREPLLRDVDPIGRGPAQPAEAAVNDRPQTLWVTVPMVASLACLGGLDECVYFPTVLLSGTFSGLELCIGAAAACLIILGTIVLLLAQMTPVLKFLDRIPLFVVVALFAIFQTVSLLLDYYSHDS